jgi:type I restriction enzyme S subunit
VPEGWAWCRLSQIIILYSGQDLEPSRYNDNSIGIPYITGASNFEDGRIIINRWTDSPTTHATIDDLLLTCKGSGVGKMVWCNIENAHIARQIMALRCIDGLYKNYLEIVMLAFLSKIVSKANGLIPGLSRDVILNMTFPLPPFNEQTQIYHKSKEILSYTQQVDKETEKLIDIINITKSKILDLAIRGKLVPQNPNDEPASVLLERIRAEKEELIKQGKIKRDKKESIIFRGDDNSYYEKNGENIVNIADEIPFDIPRNWSFIRLKDVLEYEQPTPYIVESTDYKNDYSIPVLTAGKSFIIGYTNETSGIKTDLPVIIFDDFTTDSKYVDFPFKVKSSAMKILTANEKLINTKYAFYAMQCIECDCYNHKRYWISDFSNKLIPLPPLEEQLNIVHTIEKLYNYIEKSLN